MMKMLINIVMGTAASAAVLALTGCNPADVTSYATSQGCNPGPVVFLTPDVSGSTQPQRAVNGDYETGMMKALAESAKDCATVYSAPIDANSISDGKWIIDGETFVQTIGGNSSFGAAARANGSKKLLPRVRQELRMGHPDGTDLLGSATRVEIAIESLKAIGNRPIKWIVLTDGMVNLGPELNMYTAELDTPEARKAFVGKLAKLGELPNFHGRLKLYMGGVGIGVPDRNQAKDVIKTWPLIAAAMHAKLESVDATLRFS